jgi:hypothetical protein
MNRRRMNSRPRLLCACGLLLSACTRTAVIVEPLASPDTQTVVTVDHRPKTQPSDKNLILRDVTPATQP